MHKNSGRYFNNRRLHYVVFYIIRKINLAIIKELIGISEFRFSGAPPSPFKCPCLGATMLLMELQKNFYTDNKNIRCKNRRIFFFALINLPKLCPAQNGLRLQEPGRYTGSPPDTSGSPETESGKSDRKAVQAREPSEGT